MPLKRKLIEGEDYVLNEKGLLVFTAKYLLDRGYCCGSGCTHCPYPPNVVEEAKAKKRNSRLWLG